MIPTRLQELAAMLGGTCQSNNAVTLPRNGVTVEYKLVDRGPGSSHEAWTEVSAAFPAHYPLRMTIERGRVKPGEPRIDLELGTPLFDEFFLVEAAPSDVVRHLVDEAARQFLLAQRGLIKLSAFGRTIQYTTNRWVEDPVKAGALADFVAGLASRVRDAYAAASVEPVVDTSDPYRPQAVATGADQEARRAQELDQLRMVGELREAQRQRRDTWMMLAIFGGGIVAILLGVLLSR